jgi:hypothetical protein
MSSVDEDLPFSIRVTNALPRQKGLIRLRRLA